MESTLHRQLKSLYADDVSLQEVTLGAYRVDALVDGRLIEIQHGSLGAIRAKLRALLPEHRVHVVKPLAARTYLVKRRRRGAQIVSGRYSPTRRSLFDIFDDLVHFVDVFPHPNLTLEVLLTEQEEHRMISVRRRRWFRKDYRVTDRVLRSVEVRHVLSDASDLRALLPAGLDDPFSTADIARKADIPRWLAQKMAYCLRATGAAFPCGKRGNAMLYTIEPPRINAA